MVNQMAPQLQEQLRAQGLEPGPWQLPVFVCDELQAPDVSPVFFSRATLVEVRPYFVCLLRSALSAALRRLCRAALLSATLSHRYIPLHPLHRYTVTRSAALSHHTARQAWVKSGRTKESVPANLAVMDLRVLVAQMQTDVFAWRTLTFVASADAVALVHEAKALSKAVQQRLATESDLCAVTPVTLVTLVRQSLALACSCCSGAPKAVLSTPARRPCSFGARARGRFRSCS